MPTDPAAPAPAPAPEPEPATEATAVLAVDALNSAEGGYGDRYAEDSFDYPDRPSPAPAQSWSAGEPPPGSAPPVAPAEDSDSADGEQRRTDEDRSRTAGRWQQLAARRRPALMGVAALVVMGGFGAALSMVSETVSSDSVPSGSGGTARVSAPKSPAEPSPAPDVAASAAPPAAGGAGDGVSVTSSPTGSVPGAGEEGDDEHGEDEREDRGREDDDRAGDG
ncbi:hypothetical protein [Streptomyces adelaidensis]|uniref:hypothetical protein n=1 Tax=Streptomyces adelaidensis TaxID=2796465 RepID=UPI0019082636|nr:hypothetical protein [Streptomyces adelaidensis]